MRVCVYGPRGRPHHPEDTLLSISQQFVLTASSGPLFISFFQYRLIDFPFLRIFLNLRHLLILKYHLTNFSFLFRYPASFLQKCAQLDLAIV